MLTSAERVARSTWRLAAAALVLTAVGCSPELDWRELRSAEGGFVAVLPGKPQLEERELSGHPGMVMHLWSAHAGDAVYGVGYADVPAGDRALAARMRDALVSNIAGRLVADREIALGPARGREFIAEGEKATLNARVLVADRRLYQIALIARKGGIDPDGAETFFSSFRLLPRS